MNQFDWPKDIWYGEPRVCLIVSNHTVINNDEDKDWVMHENDVDAELCQLPICTTLFSEQLATPRAYEVCWSSFTKCYCFIVQLSMVYALEQKIEPSARICIRLEPDDMTANLLCRLISLPHMHLYRGPECLDLKMYTEFLTQHIIYAHEKHITRDELFCKYEEEMQHLLIERGQWQNEEGAARYRYHVWGPTGYSSAKYYRVSNQLSSHHPSQCCIVL